MLSKIWGFYRKHACLLERNYDEFLDVWSHRAPGRTSHCVACFLGQLWLRLLWILLSRLYFICTRFRLAGGTAESRRPFHSKTNLSWPRWYLYFKTVALLLPELCTPRQWILMTNRDDQCTRVQLVLFPLQERVGNLYHASWQESRLPCGKKLDQHW